jgi:hypothetical protein
MSHWLVRTFKNSISGPYNKEALCQMILSGELTSQDEVCEAGRYWIYLHERDEVARQLGIDLPKPPKDPDDETTETQTQTQTQTETDVMMRSERTPVPAITAAVHEEQDARAEEGTQVLGSGGAASAPALAPTAAEKALGEDAVLPSAGVAQNLTPDSAVAQAIDAQPAPRVVYRPMVLGEIERPSAWRLIVWAVIVAVFVVAVVILRALKH